MSKLPSGGLKVSGCVSPKVANNSDPCKASWGWRGTHGPAQALLDDAHTHACHRPVTWEKPVPLSSVL